MKVRRPIQNAAFKLFMSRLSNSRLAIPLVLASLIGIVTGFLLVAFVKVIDFCRFFFFETIPSLLTWMGPYSLILIPAIGGLLVGPIVTYLASEAKGHGVPEVMKAVTLQGGRIRPVVVIAKAIASALAIGSGASVGREGPIVQIGSALGSNIGQAFKLGESRVRNFVACGAAAGIAGVFNAPIAGVMFSLEVILRDFGARALSTVVVAAVSSSIISRIFLGESPAFVVPSYSLSSPWEIFLYLGLGILAAFTALAFMKVLYRFEVLFDRWKFPDVWKPALGGLAVGAIGFFFPQVLGSGLETIEKVLHGGMPWNLLALLVVLKILATSLSLGSGTSGGVFAPALFIGAVMGGAFGHMVYQNMPFPVSAPGAYALVGMASVFSGAAHAPVTAILIVFEMTGDYRMILPIMVGVVAATSLAQWLQRESIYTMKLTERGIDIDSLEEVQVMGAIQVRDAMTDEFETVPRSLPVRELADRMARAKHKNFFVVDDQEHLHGIILPERVQEVLFEKDLPILIAEDLASTAEESCYPEDSLIDAAHIMMRHNRVQLPVLDAGESRKIVGVLKSEHVFRAYTEMSVKRKRLISRLEQQEVSASGTIPIHFDVPAAADIVNQPIAKLGIPHGVVLTSIQRRHKTLVPEGDTVIRARDKVWAVVIPENEQAFRDWLKTHHLELYSFFG